MFWLINGGSFSSGELEFCGIGTTRRVPKENYVLEKESDGSQNKISNDAFASGKAWHALFLRSGRRSRACCHLLVGAGASFLRRSVLDHWHAILLRKRIRNGRWKIKIPDCQNHGSQSSRRVRKEKYVLEKEPDGSQNFK